jgi:hypothetical protein
MITIQAPKNSTIKVIHILDWIEQPKPEPNFALLKKLNKGRSRQSATSKKRQNFITGVSLYRISKEELVLKRIYIEDWHHRIKENEWS